MASGQSSSVIGSARTFLGGAWIGPRLAMAGAARHPALRMRADGMASQSGTACRRYSRISAATAPGAPGGTGRGGRWWGIWTNNKAAIRCSPARGVAEPTLNDLLEVARVSRRTFYKVFRGKLGAGKIYHTSVQLLLARFGGLRSEASSDEGRAGVVSLAFDYYLAVGRSFA